MKILKLKKIIASSLIVMSVLALSPIGVSAAWRQDNRGWWYTEGNSWAVGWKMIDGKWYYFYNNGYMAHDTVIDGYKIDSNGVWIQNSTESVNNGAVNNRNLQNEGQQQQQQQQPQQQQQQQQQPQR